MKLQFSTLRQNSCFTILIINHHKFILNGSVEVQFNVFDVSFFMTQTVYIGELVNTELPSPIKEAVVTSSILGAVGAVLFGLAILFNGKIMRWPGLLLIIAAVASVLELANEFFGFIGFILTLIAVLWMSIKVLKQRTA